MCFLSVTFSLIIERKITENNSFFYIFTCCIRDGKNDIYHTCAMIKTVVCRSCPILIDHRIQFSRLILIDWVSFIAYAFLVLSVLYIGSSKYTHVGCSESSPQFLEIFLFL